jgi:hypothetical protein
MSKRGFPVRDALSCHALLRNSRPPITACALILVAVLLTASCGLVEQNSQGNGNNLALTGNLPGGAARQAYNAVLAVSGGSAPYQFAIKSGSLPPGMTLNPTTGSISGTPTTAGAYSFHVAVTDIPLPDQGGQNFAISIAPGNGGGIHVSVSPLSAILISNQTQTFTATVTGTDNSSVSWSASAGSITQQGLFTAPTVSAVTTVYVTATSSADSQQHAVATVTVEPPNGQQLAITNGSLPDGQMGDAYSAAFAATGGTQPYTWAMSGNLPPGLTLTQNNGQFSGMPGSAGTFSFTVTVRDTKAQKAQKNFALNILSANGNFDGPAELPRATVATSMADTPAPGAVVFVNSGGDLQAALNNAHCGDILELQAGATFTGNFKFPAKNCDNGHWIIVRSSAPDSFLPPEGQRATPCFAGVASLTGRPPYPCNNPQNVMARLMRGDTGDGPVVFQAGANHYRLLGLELTRPVGVKGVPTLVSLVKDSAADHIIVDRSWLHGTTQDETVNGFSMKGMNYAAIVDSYLNDFHCTAVSGACGDSHAVGGGNGNHQDGPFKISNNFLEAAGESVMFGGGAATVTPTDIEIRRNHFFKPWQWMRGNPGFVGGPTGDAFVVKNHLELKNAIRVLVEANLMENVWGGFSQTGHAILLTPKNQHTRDNGNVCPLCQVTDVTIRYTHMAHAGGGMALVTGISGDGKNGGPALAGTRWSIHDIVMDDINHNYVGGGTLFEFQNGWPLNPLNTVTINHITAFPDPGSHLIIMGNLAANPKMYGLVFTNNLVGAGRNPVASTGGGPTTCAYSGTPAEKINTCFLTNTFTNNALIGTPDAFPPSSWPAGNFFPANANAAGFAPDGGGAVDYELNTNSPYKNAGTDGKDLGADIVGLEAALTGVE